MPVIEVPTALTSGDKRMLNQVVDRLHVSTSLSDVTRTVRRKMRRGIWDEMSSGLRNQITDYVQARHEDNRRSYSWVMSGMHGSLRRQVSRRNPMPNYHSVRVKPRKKAYKTYRYGANVLGGGIDVVYGILRYPDPSRKRAGRSEIQSIRFDRDRYSLADVKNWMREHPEFTPLKIEPATGPTGKEGISMNPASRRTGGVWTIWVSKTDGGRKYVYSKTHTPGYYDFYSASSSAVTYPTKAAAISKARDLKGASGEVPIDSWIYVRSPKGVMYYASKGGARSNQPPVERSAASIRQTWEEREQEGKRRAMEARPDIERKMRPVDHYQPTWALRNMIRALEIMSWQNTVDDWQRYYEAKYILQLRRQAGSLSRRIKRK